MTPLLDATLRASAVLGSGLVLVALSSRRSAAVRHALLAGAVFSSGLAVAASWVLPGWHVAPFWWRAPLSTAAQSGSRIATGIATTMPVVPDRTGFSPDTLLLLVWATGVLLGAGVLISALVRLKTISRRAQVVTAGPWRRAADVLTGQLGVRRPVTLLQTDMPGFLATWGLRHPRIGLPRDADGWPEARIHAVLSHELSHVRRRDWVVQIAAQFICTAQWFNPICWVAGARLRELSEMACDDDALSGGIAADEYAAHLLEVTRSCRPPSAPLAAVPMARAATFERRIVAMLNRNTDRQPVTRRDLAIVAVLLLLVAAPAAVLHARQAGPLPFTGSIYDASGALLPEVSVTLIDGRQQERTATTDAEGRFTIQAVPPGKYSLRVMRAGFAPLAQDVELTRTGDWSRVVTLQVGEVQEQVRVETERPATRPAAAPAGPIALKVGGHIQPPKKIKHTNPIYPQSMKDAGIEGTVPIEAVIAGDGSVQTVRVLTSEVHPDLAIAAVDAVRQWKFEPTLLNGKPVAIKMKVTIDFRLKD